MSSRRAGPSASHRRNRAEPVILSARRPTTPASGSPPAPEPLPDEATPEGAATEPAQEDKPRVPRAARIVAAGQRDVDQRLLERERLLGRLLASEGRGAVTRAADQYLKAGFDFPMEQPVQLQLLEHHDEALVRCAIDALRGIVASEPPLKRPIFEQRLKRLEDSAEEETTRVLASELRRALRG
ncbi:MAG TPA: hypothetical protein VMS65_03045 [Polyangiaceae bacterium]|nr:hypothetical protein [Polyangiaceae bacterium]